MLHHPILRAYQTVHTLPPSVYLPVFTQAESVQACTSPHDLIAIDSEAEIRP